MTSSSSPTVLARSPHLAVGADDAAALTAIVKRLTLSWADNDADALAQIYAEDATVVLPGDVYLKGRREIRDWMANAFEGKWKGTHVLGIPLELRYLADNVGMLISHGGAYQPGASEVSTDDAIRGIWIFTKQGSEWTVAAYENTPVRATIPIPEATG